MLYVKLLGRDLRHATLPLVAALCVSCGGEGGTPSPTPTNTAPQFTSSATASVGENSSGTIYTASASDGDGDALRFSVSGGPDSAAFSISGGSLTFKQAPNFERPTDSDRDNVYNVTITVQDGRGGSANLNLAITVTNDKEGIAVTRVATGFADPAGLGFLLTPSGGAAEGRIAVAQENGEVFEVDGTTGARTLMADVFAGRPRGKLLAIGFNGRRQNFYSGLYAVAQEPDGRVFMQRYTPRPLSEIEVLPTGSGPVSAKIFAGPDRSLPGGDLFMTLSDESGAFAQAANSPLGKLIFLEEWDPYAGASLRGGHTVRIIGDGIRKSGGAGAVNGQILLSDQGGSLEQEMTFFAPDARPLDFGWPSREGTQGTGSNPPTAVNGPTIAYPFGTGPDGGTGIVFGGVYKGAIADLDNDFIFGDRNGGIWGVPLAELTSGFLLRPQQMDRRRQDFVPDRGQIESPVAFIVDDKSRLFILDADGELFRVDPA